MSEVEFASNQNDELLQVTADVVAAYVGNNPVPIGELPKLIEDIYGTLGRLGASSAPAAEVEKQQPAVSIKKSITPDYLISLEDGGQYRSLTRHLSSKYGMTPDDYRRKWGLPSDYPMVAPNYSAKRSELAKSLGLGRKPGSKNKA